jgi:hypothetical protein
VIFTTWWHWWNNINMIWEGETPMSRPVLVRRTKCCTPEHLEFFSTNTNEFWSSMFTAHIPRAMIRLGWVWLLDD